MNGNTLTGPADGSTFVVEEGGSLTIKGDGVISSAFGGSVVKVMPGAELTVESGTIEATGANAQAIRVEGTATINGGTITATEAYGISAMTEGSKLIVNGGEISGGFAAILGNGNHEGVTIEINGGKIFSDNDTAIYHPQDGVLNITDGEISGKVGVEVRAGEVNISGGTITATGEFEIEPNGNGSTVIGGVAVAISQHTTNKDINVTISGGTFSGETYSLYEEDVQDEASDNIAISVTGGDFKGAVHSENVTGFISGGTFDTDVTQYKA